MEHNHGGLDQIIFLSKWLISRFHVNLPGCSFFFFVATIWAEVCEHRWEGIGGLVNFRQARQFLVIP